MQGESSDLMKLFQFGQTKALKFSSDVILFVTKPETNITENSFHSSPL